MKVDRMDGRSGLGFEVGLELEFWFLSRQGRWKVWVQG